MDRNHRRDIGKMEGQQSGNKETSSALRRGSQVFVSDDVRSWGVLMLIGLERECSRRPSKPVTNFPHPPHNIATLIWQTFKRHH
jgi:hypothetical protein